MNSDSESQDSDEGRRFRFATTRKDSVPQPRKTSPQTKHKEQRSQSREKSSRSNRENSSHRHQSSNDRDTNNRHTTKDRSLRDARSSSRERSSRRHHAKESRSQRKNYDSKESKSHNSNKHKSKSKEKHKKRSRDRSHEKSSKKNEESVKNDKRKIDSAKVAVEENVSKKLCTETDNIKVNLKNDNKNEPINYHSTVISGNIMTDIASSRKKPKSFFERVVKKNDLNDDNFYGPALPPKLEKAMINAREAEVVNVTNLESTKIIDSNQLRIGPSLPENVKTSFVTAEKNKHNKKQKTAEIEERVDIKYVESKEEKEEDEDSFGPALPPHLQRRKIVGPTLPNVFVTSTEAQNAINNIQSESEEDATDVVGPLPADHPANKDNHIQLQLEYRARKVREKFMEKATPEKNKREEWMIELPPAQAVALGLGSIPRKFKASEGPDMSDRSMWTDTPQDRRRKEKEKEENRFVPSKESNDDTKNDKDNLRQVEERKGDSLLDMHLKTLKKKKKKLEKEAKELGLSTRKPFNRDEDLQTNRLDEARKKKIFEKASRLNDRFTVGKF